jgi:hypothetical protein
MYLESLKKRLGHRFDIYENTDQTEQLGVDLLATYSLRDEKHMLTRKITLYALEEYEHCLVHVFEQELTLQQAAQFAEGVSRSMALMVHPHHDHKRTILTGVLIAEQGCQEAVKNFVARYHREKIFQCYMKGWCEVRLVLVDLCGGTVAHRANSKSRHLGRMYKIPDAM